MDCGRDPLLWPYPATSIWNRPVGQEAVLVPVRLGAPATDTEPAGPPLPQRTIRIEEGVIIASPGAADVTIAKSSAGWGSGNRCTADAPEVAVGTVPIPRGWDTTGIRTKQNRPTAIVRPDLTLFETQPVEVCGAGADWHVTSLVNKPSWQGESLITGGNGPYPDGAPVKQQHGGGAHGGSFMSAYGGTIRLGEWVAGGVIPHATKIVVPPRLLSACDLLAACDGFRWPALAADAAFKTPGAANAYSGTNPYLQMGALLTLPGDLDVESLLTSEPAKILARSLQRYGSYVVDVTGSADNISFAAERGPRGSVEGQFASSFGYAVDTPKNRTGISPEQQAFFDDMDQIYRYLEVVDDNAPGAAGAGEPRWSAAPELTDYPVGTVATPYPGEVFSTATPTMRGFAYDYGPGLDKIRWEVVGLRRLADRLWLTKAGTWVPEKSIRVALSAPEPGASAMLWTWTPPVALEDGDYQLTARARAFGEKWTEIAVRFAIDAIDAVDAVE